MGRDTSRLIWRQQCEMALFQSKQVIWNRKCFFIKSKNRLSSQPVDNIHAQCMHPFHRGHRRWRDGKKEQNEKKERVLVAFLSTLKRYRREPQFGRYEGFRYKGWQGILGNTWICIAVETLTKPVTETVILMGHKPKF